MKKVILSLTMFAFLASGSVCMAQDRSQRMNPQQRVEQMVKDLGLNEEQTKEFKALMETMRPQRGQQGERPSREEMQKKELKWKPRLRVFSLKNSSKNIKKCRRIVAEAVCVDVKYLYLQSVFINILIYVEENVVL